jgi:hypothetical protein
LKSLCQPWKPGKPCLSQCFIAIVACEYAFITGQKINGCRFAWQDFLANVSLPVIEMMI